MVLPKKRPPTDGSILTGMNCAIFAGSKRVSRTLKRVLSCWFHKDVSRFCFSYASSGRMCGGYSDSRVWFAIPPTG